MGGGGGGGGIVDVRGLCIICEIYLVEGVNINLLSTNILQISGKRKTKEVNSYCQEKKVIGEGKEIIAKKKKLLPRRKKLMPRKKL